MIRTQEHLAPFIADALKEKPSCRILQDVISACFGNKEGIPDADQIFAFAEKHGWRVEISVPANYGLVCEFFPG